MKITYIHHSSFMAELDHAVLLFDYFEGNIPEADREKPLFASHRHGDHFSRSIFDLEESRGNVTYVLSDDIWTRQVPEELLGRTIFLGPGEKVSLRDGAGIRWTSRHLSPQTRAWPFWPAWRAEPFTMQGI